MKRYEGKKVVIIGGTSGMGLATAKMLLDGGARVVVTGRSKEGLESSQKELGNDAIVVSSDARSLPDLDALASRVKAEFDTIDLLFVNAGFLMLFGGASWTAIMSLFNIIVQELAPDWVRARVLAVYLFVFQGSVTVGSTLWGFVALRTNVHATLAAASIGTAACLLLRPWFRLPDTKLDLSIWNHWVKPAMIEEPEPDEGPVLVTVKYVIDPAKAPEFLHQIHNYERIRRRDGAISWGIFVDTEAPNTYLESFQVDSWAEHERQHNRFTQADREVEEQVLSFAIKPVEVQHYIYAREEPRFSKTDS